jgi:predicted O-linked N-acetylglucosamine transferase (SPINDLY family)
MTIPQAFDLALQRHRAGRLAEAEALYRQIIAAQPEHAEAWHHLGVIAHQVGRDDLAVEWIRRAIGLRPNHAAAHCNLGEACRATRRFDEAIAAFQRALELAPDYPEAHNNLGAALKAQGQLDQAIAAYRRALALQPKFPEARNNLGAALAAEGRTDEAMAEYRQALELDPACPATHLNLGNALRERDRLEEAIAAYRTALRLQPAYPQALSNLGVALTERGRPGESVAACRRALELKPDYSEAYNNLGVALAEQGLLDEGAAAYRRALALQPDDAEVHNNLGDALREQGQLDEAIAEYRQALRLQPQDACAQSNLILSLHLHPDHDARSISEERQRWNRRLSDPLKPFLRPHANDSAVAGRKLRIGYVSPDFRDHPVGRQMLPLFERHDRERFHILCYSGVARADSITERLRELAGGWRSTRGVGDARLAEMIREDAVDILVDLALHTAGNRLPVFARKPAPVQVSFAGYPESTGLDAIEYRISDRHLEMAVARAGADEREQVRLIDSFWCYDPRGAELEVNGSPAGQSGRVTFGCLNSFCKVNARTLALWARVLGRVRDSRLIVLCGAGSHRQRTLEAIEKQGVEAGRVEFVEYRPRREYLELYYRLDIVLDTYPYNGHTTSLDAHWMGVPVVSLAGHSPVSRGGLSQLTNLGLPELAATTEAEYVNIAEGLARDVPRLTQLRATLRARMRASPLMDATRFARGIERAYLEMWGRWCGEE